MCTFHNKQIIRTPSYSLNVLDCFNSYDSLVRSVRLLALYLLHFVLLGCNITCHRKCRYSVVLDCRGPLKLQARMSRSDAGNQSWDVDITRDVIVSPLTGQIMIDIERRSADKIVQ